MHLINNDLADMLGSVKTPGDFYAAGVCAMHAPLLRVKGVGPIALPLLAAQAEQLIAVAERAPYGRGKETLLDTQVRRSWQISAECVRIEGSRWQAALQSIVERAVLGLGAGAGVVAELYKLLLYDEGGFFVPHRDTEKSPGMFGTLIVGLPSLHTGGDIVVRHRGREVRLDLRCGDPSEVAFVAFYADCVHEVLPLTSGYRPVLIYNLLSRGRGRRPTTPRPLRSPRCCNSGVPTRARPTTGPPNWSTHWPMPTHRPRCRLRRSRVRTPRKPWCWQQRRGSRAASCIWR